MLQLRALPVGLGRPGSHRLWGALHGAAWCGVLALSTLVLGGCLTGKRPSFDHSATAPGAVTGDAPVDRVLDLLDGVGGAVFTADYQIDYTAIGASTTARVTQSSSSRRSITIGSVRFLRVDGTDQTCQLDTGACSSGIDDRVVSNTGVTSDFAFGAIAKRLRHDAGTHVAPTVASTSSIADRDATCVDVPVSGGTKTYCSLGDGVLGRFIGGDVTITLTNYAITATPALFATSR